MSSLCVQCRNPECGTAFVLPSWIGGGHLRFTDQLKAVSSLQAVEQREAAVDLHNARLDAGVIDLASFDRRVPHELKPKSFPVTCPVCRRAYLYSHRHAFLSQEPDLPDGLRP